MGEAGGVAKVGVGEAEDVVADGRTAAPHFKDAAGTARRKAIVHRNALDPFVPKAPMTSENKARRVLGWQ